MNDNITKVQLALDLVPGELYVLMDEFRESRKFYMFLDFSKDPKDPNQYIKCKFLCGDEIVHLHLVENDFDLFKRVSK